jgi:plasmid stabilization system protein ParE
VASIVVELHPGAVDDIEQGRGWYQERNPVVADAFLAEVDRAMSLIAEAPNRWPFRYDRARAYVMADFPYTVFYAERTGSAIVLAVASDYRLPHYWKDRR